LHDINLAICFSSHLLLIKEGRNQAAGRKEDVLDEGKFAQLYNLPFCLKKEAGGECWVKISYK
jgi:ABC-type cobalamin/Fe3+-siderophores transport system ATPase subunit